MAQRLDPKNIKFPIFFPYPSSKILSGSAPACPNLPKSVRTSGSGLKTPIFVQAAVFRYSDGSGIIREPSDYRYRYKEKGLKYGRKSHW